MQKRFKLCNTTHFKPLFIICQNNAKKHKRASIDGLLIRNDTQQSVFQMWQTELILKDDLENWNIRSVSTPLQQINVCRKQKL